MIDQLGAALEDAARAIAGVGEDAEIEGLALPLLDDVGLADTSVRDRQDRAGAGAEAVIVGAHAPHSAGLAGAQIDHGMSALQVQSVVGVGLYSVSTNSDSPCWI